MNGLRYFKNLNRFELSMSSALTSKKNSKKFSKKICTVKKTLSKTSNCHNFVTHDKKGKQKSGIPFLPICNVP